LIEQNFSDKSFSNRSGTNSFLQRLADQLHTRLRRDSLGGERGQLATSGFSSIITDTTQILPSACFSVEPVSAKIFGLK
jgi:hypothetical protein